ncbi:MAG: TonB-dependent receptor, partial [Robiginitomaculum sp.]|nr:TonB-dependent receptor [Robiginitomaculum sp.]
MRYLPLTDVDRQKMLATIGVANIDELFSDIPKSARLADGLSDLPDHAPEQLVERHFTQMSAQNISAGFVVDLDNGLNLTFDYFQIDVDDRVSLVNAANNIQYFSNLVDTETSGFDVVLSGALDLGPGALNWNASYNNSETTVRNPSVLGPEDLNTIETASPQEKFIVAGNFDMDQWSMLLRITRYGDATRVFDFGGGFEPTQTYDAVWSVDAELAAQISDDWMVAVGADNLLDEYPDLSDGNINYFGHLPYDVLSP